MDLSWYNSLSKPFFTPPSWLFAPAWTVLYTLMAIAAYLIFKKGIKKRKIQDALKLFGIQLAVNIIWTPIFFGLRDVLLALIVIIVLWYLILKTIKSFEKIDKVAGYLLWPYLAWVSFATILNFSVWFLNR